jgi:hypothetical protein
VVQEEELGMWLVYVEGQRILSAMVFGDIALGTVLELLGRQSPLGMERHL